MGPRFESLRGHFHFIAEITGFDYLLTVSSAALLQPTKTVIAVLEPQSRNRTNAKAQWLRPEVTHKADSFTQIHRRNP
jgi:hypothetical protein